MLQIKTLASGSTGNAIWISDGATPLLLECGIAFDKIQKALNFQTSKIGGVLVSHEHGDHVKGLKTLLKKSALKVYMSQGTKDAIGIDDHRIIACKPLEQFRVGSWIVKPFDVQHDVSEPFAFLLYSDYGHRVLFATDTYYIKYNFSSAKLTHILIECNYDQQTIDENVANGSLHPAQRKRVMKSHMQLETLISFFQANDLSQCEEIHLLHLSDRNANRERIFNEVAKATGKMIYMP